MVLAFNQIHQPWFNGLRHFNYSWGAMRVKAVAQMRLGQDDAARETGRKLLKLQPGLRVSEWLKNAPSSDYENGREFGRTLREIGIPN